MKIKILKKICVLAVLMIVGTNVNAQSTVCKSPIGSGNTLAYISWATDVNGNVVITISGANGDTGAEFRGNGFAHDGFFLEDGTTDLRATFNIASTTKTVTLSPKNAITEELTIKFNPNKNRNIEWKTSENTNAYSNSIQFEYTYGSTCPKLGTPAITSLETDGTISFNSVSDAENYMVYVYKADYPVHSQLIESGEKINFESYTDYTYTVKLQAISGAGTVDSDLSIGENWVLTAVSPVGKSEYCDYGLKPNNANENALLSINTIGSNVVISVAEFGTNGATTFNEDALGGTFLVNGKSINNFFDKTYTTNSNKNEFVLNLKADADISVGDIITYSGLVKWKIGNAGRNQQHNLSYTYGTTCGEFLATPGITNIVDSVIAFTPISNADKYLVQIYRNDFLVHTQTITNSDRKITGFAPTVTSDYTVKMKAQSNNEDYLDSDFSEPYTWSLEVGEVVLGKSEYCDFDLKPDNADQNAYISWNTNKNGDVVISISEAGNGITTFRGPAMEAKANGFKVNGKPIDSYFEITYVDNSNKTDYILKLKEDSGIVPGDIITYSGQVAWYTNGSTGRNQPHNFTYTYGTVCGEWLNTPEISNISNDGIITFDAVDHADNYTIYIYRDIFPVHSQTILPGEKINFMPNTAFYIYEVKIKAASSNEAYLDSELSEPYHWSLTSEAPELGKSEYCEYQIGNELLQHAFLSWNTRNDGSIVITISGYEEDEDVDFRGNGLNIDNFKVYGLALKDYFDKTTEHQTIILSPKDDTSLYRGDKITYSGTTEWKVATLNPAGNYSFEYTYGTICDTAEKTQLPTPVITAIDEAGNITFETVSNTENYVVQVYKDDNLVHSQTIEASGEKVNFTSFVDYTYVVKLKAVPAADSNFLESELSEGYEWTLLGQEKFSEYCKTSVITDNTTVSYTIETDENGNITISISAIEGDNDVYFSEQGWPDMATGLKVNGQAVNFTKTDGDKNLDGFYSDFTLSTAEKMTLGDVITYMGTVELIAGAYPISGEILISYTYGTVCEKEPVNEIVVPNASKEIIFYPNPATDFLHFTAAVKEVSLYSLQGQMVLSLQDSEKIDVSGFAKGMYIVKIVDYSGNETVDKVKITPNP